MFRYSRDAIDGETAKLTDAARAEKNAASREWRKKNPAKVREYNRRYWERKAEKRGENRQTTMHEQTKGAE